MISQTLVSIARKARGVLGMALVWGLAWVPISIALLPAVFGTGQVWNIDSRAFIAIAMEGFVAGALNGAAFGLVLAAAERRRRLSQLKPGRIATYGALAGGAIAGMVMGIASLASPNFVVSPLLAAELAFFAGLGAVSAFASVAVARRGILIKGLSHLEKLPNASEI